MPAPSPVTFATAAASNGTGEGGPSRSAAGSADWSRPRMNGSQTFRRPTQLNTSVSTHQRESSTSVQTPSSAVYVPPHMNSAVGRVSSGVDYRYAKEQLFEIYRSQADASHRDVTPLLTEGWLPGQAGNVSSSISSWVRRDEAREQNLGPEICWDEDGATKPLGLIDMSEEERELFSSSVNSLLKPPQPNAVKEGTQAPGVNGRKPSVSQGTGPLSGRPSVRRRDTSESFSGNPLASPTFTRGGREENPLASPPPSLLRRRTDIKDGGLIAEVGRLDTGDTKSPFASLKRTTTNPLSASINGPSSPWSTEPPSAGGFGRMGSFGVADQAADKKQGSGATRGGSRFFSDLRSKDSGDEGASKRDSKGFFGLDKLAEESASPADLRQTRGVQRVEGTPAVEEADARSGSAALLLGGEDASPPQQSLLSGLERQPRREDSSFSGLGGSSDLPPFRERMLQQQQRKDGPQQHDQSHQYMGGSFHEPMSPTDTNPYHSPDNEKSSVDRSRDEEQDPHEILTQGSLPPRYGQFEASEGGSRSSSTAPPRNSSGLGGFSGFSGLGGWPATGPGSMGQGMAAKPPFNDSLFGSLGDLGSPGTGGVFIPSNIGQGSFGGSSRSKLGSLFPTAMHDQMRAGGEPRQDFFGSIGASNPPPRDTDSPAARSGRNLLDDLFAGPPSSRAPASQPSPFGGPDPFAQGPGPVHQQPPFSTAVGTPSINAQAQQQPTVPFFPRGPEDDSNVPESQRKTMVMPDRMRWIYRDPQGNIQGPWSGLEMHDWYKAGFFSPELQVKKVEDPDYEPLAQLIRRIGNSREPFLVPQIGIPHGSVVGGQGGGVSGANNTGGVQPPFASSFPSFGTTLTAEQQNALERRKQEEQYLMAQQKEFLQQKQQMLRNQMQFPGGPGPMHPGQLHHHSSAHSLQSQPSFGSMGTPAVGFPPAAGPGPQPIGMPGGPGLFDMQRGQPGFGPVGPMPQTSREDELSSSFERMNMARMGQSPFGGPGPMPQSGIGPDGPNPVAQMLQDRNRLQQEQYEALQRAQGQPQDASQGFDRLQEFNWLRQEQDSSFAGIIGKPQQHRQSQPPVEEVEEQEVAQIAGSEEMLEEPEGTEEEEGRRPALARPEPISLPSKDVTDVKTMAPEDVPQAQTAWQQVEKPQSQSIEAPPPSISPLPAPAAQRATRHVVEAIQAENLSRSQTPSVETPSSSLAPWAKETAEAPKVQSFQEIQEAEARKAAQQEAQLAEHRRQLAEQERLAQAAAPIPAPGLPSSASWAASNASPASPGASAWVKPLAGKATPTAKTKTLAQIQKEEEARKNKAAAQAAAAVNVASALSSGTSTVGGKRYAELAGKVAAPTGPASGLAGGAWTTVGASGKAKAPGAPVATRTVSGPIPTTASAAVAGATAKKPAQPVRANTMQSATSSANEETMKWARLALGKGVNANINVDEFVRSLMTFPLEVEIISDTIYSASTTLDGRRLADEFVRRRKLAEKGIVPEGGNLGGAPGAGSSAAGSASPSNNGWSEVAKQKPVVKEEPSGFRMVQGKKKTSKR